jgi:Domain of unknown function (DUF1851)
MAVDWSALTFTPSNEAIAQLRESWAWLLTEPFVPVLFSTIGDVFFEPASGGIWWLNAGTGDVTRVAGSVDQFRDLLATELADEWFMPGLIEQLHAAGKVPKAGQCYSYAILPIFAEGKYEVWNLRPMSAKDHFYSTAYVLCEARALPNGAKVKLKVVD